jgi:hypothetical protein
VARAPDALQAGGDRLRRLDLEHEVDRAHVDAELERRGRDQAREVARLQHLLDDQPLLARERPVVGAGDVGGLAVLPGQLVQTEREALGGAAGVDEDDRRAVLLHELEQLGVDRRPDRSAGGRAVAVQLVQVSALVGLLHVLDRHLDLQVERLAQAGVDDRAVAARADQEAADLLERALRGRQPDALERA